MALLLLVCNYISNFQNGCCNTDDMLVPIGKLRLKNSCIMSMDHRAWCLLGTAKSCRKPLKLPIRENRLKEPEDILIKLEEYIG